jgi:hypothetical protein
MTGGLHGLGQGYRAQLPCPLYFTITPTFSVSPVHTILSRGSIFDCPSAIGKGNGAAGANAALEAEKEAALCRGCMGDYMKPLRKSRLTWRRPERTSRGRRGTPHRVYKSQ